MTVHQVIVRATHVVVWSLGNFVMASKIVKMVRMSYSVNATNVHPMNMFAECWMGKSHCGNVTCNTGTAMVTMIVGTTLTKPVVHNSTQKQQSTTIKHHGIQ
ncbi:hypothetical protein X801_00652 [Opisthorchis viverrini]|uniref:Uncharacterized protein n=1 Tax=Opisthorchis viverrini TaxID=6198 RepID=A0A1S8X9V4_OPIVI|nr:hypothetical protein X801_00652 [Opisthorchis viverrini]